MRVTRQRKGQPPALLLALHGAGAAALPEASMRSAGHGTSQVL